MSYVVRLMGGDEVEITDEEFASLQGKTGLLFIPSVGEVVNLSSVSHIFPAENRKTAAVDRSKQFEGVLSSGERVVKRFGIWYLADGPERDEEGNSLVQPDPELYPEITSGLLPTPVEYESCYKTIPSKEWSRLIAGNDHERPVHSIDKRSSTEGLTKIELDKGDFVGV